MIPENCPQCGVSLQGEPIPQEYIDKGYYSQGTTHYSRLMGIEGNKDRIEWWQCPDCGYRWERPYPD